MNDWWNDLGTLQTYNSRLLWLAAFLGICTSIAILITVKLGDRIGDLEDKEKLETRARISANEASTAKANAEAEVAKAAAAEARLELAKIDPMNLPIKILRGDVFFLVPEKDVRNTSLASQPFPFSNFTMLLTQEGTETTNRQIYALLRCISGESRYMQLSPDSAPYRSVKLSFEWPDGNMSDAILHKINPNALWIEANSISTSKLDELAPSAVVILPDIASNMEIQTATFTLTINGSILRRFSFLPHSENQFFIARPEATK